MHLKLMSTDAFMWISCPKTPSDKAAHKSEMELKFGIFTQNCSCVSGARMCRCRSKKRSWQWYLDVNRYRWIPAWWPSLEQTPQPCSSTHPRVVLEELLSPPDWPFWCRHARHPLALGQFWPVVPGESWNHLGCSLCSHLLGVLPWALGRWCISLMMLALKLYLNTLL